MKHEAHVFFAVFEFGQDLSIVTKLAGFEPSDSWIVGEPMRNHPTATHRHSRWTFQSPLPLHAPVEEHLAAVLSRLEANAAGVRSVLSLFPAHIGCAVYYRTFTPGIWLPQQLLARVATLALGIDLDMYFLGEADETDDLISL